MTTTDRASRMAKAEMRTIRRRVIRRDGLWLLLNCGHEVTQSAGSLTGRHAQQRACQVCERLERNYARWLRKGLVTKTEARGALRCIRKARRRPALHARAR